MELKMNDNERREKSKGHILVVAHDELWSKFVENTLRRTDAVEDSFTLDEAREHLKNEKYWIIILSSKVVPDKVHEFESFLSYTNNAKIIVVRHPKDTHHRINDKHLKQMGVIVEDRPTDGKGLRRLMKIASGK